jgi:hypothetical protein
VDAVRHGLTNRQIATRRGVSLDAVKAHVASAAAKLGLSGRAALRAWSGTPRDSAVRRRDEVPPRKETTMSGSVQLGALGQVARAVSDIAKAEAWYRDVLGLPHLYTFGTLAFFDCGGTVGALHAVSAGRVMPMENVAKSAVGPISSLANPAASDLRYCDPALQQTPCNA